MTTQYAPEAAIRNAEVLYAIRHDMRLDKYASHNLNPDIVVAALGWFQHTRSTFRFVQELRALPRLSNGQIAAVANCAIAELISEHNAVKTAMQQLRTSPAESKAAVRDGIYTVVFPADDSRVTLRVGPADWAGSESDDSGPRVVAALTGSDNERDYTSFAFARDGVARIWRRFESSHEASRWMRAYAVLAEGDQDARASAGLAYAIASGRCCRCDRRLTVPASLHAGMGPVCAKGGRD